MKISGEYDSQKSYKNYFQPINDYGDPDLIELNKRNENLRNFVSQLPSSLTSLSFESEDERQKYLSKFQQKEVVGGFYGLYQPLLFSSILIGYYGPTETGFYAHIDSSLF